jgi:hypothetical protein
MKYVLLLAFLTASLSARAQKIYDLEITGDYREVTLIEMLLDIEKRYPVRFYYDPDILPYYKIGYEATGQTLFHILQTLLPRHSLTLTTVRDNGIIICRKADLNAAYAQALLKKWDEQRIELPEFLQPLALALQVGEAPASRAATVAVRVLVIDEETKEPVAGVVVRGETPQLGATSDRFGRFELSLTPGRHTLTIAALGYRETHVALEVYQAGVVTVEMQTRALELATVEIQGNKAANKQTSVTPGVELLSTQTIRELPSFMGEADVVKSLLVLPGVTTVGEGASGFNVRGGNIDQNLVVQDELPFFNTSHVLGFFSVFNPDLVRSTTLYKGNLPARFGGRTASALEVKLRDGSFTDWEGSAGVGLAAAKAAVEGPLWKDRLSVLAGVRASYSDWMLKRARLPEVNTSSAWFNDATAKLSFRGGENSLVSAGFHRSDDYFRFSQQFGYSWRTTGGNAAWRQTWNQHLLTTVTAAAGRVENLYFQPQGSDAFELSSGLAFQSAQAQALVLGVPGHELQAGAQWNRTDVLPQSLRPYGPASGQAPRTVDLESGEELAFYVDDEFDLTSRIALYAGVRYSLFRTVGPGQVLTYEPGAPYSVATASDTLQFAAGATVQRYGGIEPRLSLSVRVTTQHSVKLSYNRLRQYLHLISNTAAATPADVWQVSNRYLRPQVSDNYGVGWFFTAATQWEASVEGFYRNTDGVPAYEDFALLLLNDHLETELITGRQRSYGVESMLRKNRGRWTGWLSYTWSRVWQQARSPFPELSVNRGAWFPANFDQPHQATIFAKYEVTPALYWNFNFVYRTGRPVTAPTSGYLIGNVVVPHFSDRNTLRIADYHRLDVGLTMDKTRSKLDGLKWTANFSIYNLYGRNNPFSVYFKRDRNGLPRAYELSVIGTAIPAATLTVYW